MENSDVMDIRQMSCAKKNVSRSCAGRAGRAVIPFTRILK